MSNYREDYISYRLERSGTAFDDALLLAENGRWNASVNRLYYACYYAVSALLLQNDIHTQTHAGCKTQFGLHFVKTAKVTIEQGRLYADLMDWRQKGDYGDMFDFDSNAVTPLFAPVKNFLETIRSLVEKGSSNKSV